MRRDRKPMRQWERKLAELMNDAAKFNQQFSAMVESIRAMHRSGEYTEQEIDAMVEEYNVLVKQFGFVSRLARKDITDA